MGHHGLEDKKEIVIGNNQYKTIRIAVGFIAIMLGVWLFYLGINHTSEYLQEQRYNKEYKQIVESAQADIALYKSGMNATVEEIHKKIEDNSYLWGACEGKSFINVDYVLYDVTMHKQLPCDLLQPYRKQQNDQLRDQRTTILNEMCKTVYDMETERQMKLDSFAVHSNYDPRDTVFDFDTSCYDDSVLNINDKRRMPKVSSITIHHTATDSVDVERAVRSASRHHGVAPAHYFIDKDGNVINTRPVEEVVGSTLDPLANRRSIHIELVGNFVGTSATEKQMQALVEVIEKLGRQYPHLKTITGHRYRNSPTTCPGDFDFNKLMSLLSDHWVLWEGIQNPQTPVAEEPQQPKKVAFVPSLKVGDVIYMDNVTAYYGPQRDQSYYFRGSYEADLMMNCGGEDQCVNAMGRPYKEDHRYTHGACGPRFPKGTVLHLEGRGEIVCVDRGSAIDNTDIDIRYGRGEDAMLRIRGGKAHPKTGEATVISLPK